MAGFALLLGAAPAARSEPAVDPDGGPYRVQMLYRTGRSLAPIEITIRGATDNDFGMWYAIELVRDHRGRWVDRHNGFGGYQELGGTPYPAVYGHPEASRVPRCPDLPGCVSPVPFPGALRFGVRPVATSRYYLVSAHADVGITTDSPHWRVKDVPNPGARRVFADRAQATGVHTWGTAVERFTSASAPGGRYGSAVLAYVPCTVTGQGTARLTARGAETHDGAPPNMLRCGLRISYSYEYAFTRQPATWRLDGDIIGVGAMFTRLFVFDFPKP